MNILHTVEFYYPSVGGAQEVVRQLSEHIAGLGHEVTVATTQLPEREKLTHNGVKIAEFAISGNRVRGIEGDVDEFHRFLTNGDFDVVMNYAAQQWASDLFFDVIDQVEARKVFVPCGYSALFDPAYEQYFAEMPGILRKYDATVYMADQYRDIDFARKHGLGNIHVIPNGADETEFSDSLTTDEKAELRRKHGIRGIMIMTIANYTGEKGHAELLDVFKRLPSRATLVSAGSTTPGIGCFDAFAEEAERINGSRRFPEKRVVMLEGRDRPLVRDMLKCADLFVLLSNIEASPLVLYEAAAAGVPFIASDVGNSGEIAKWTNGGVIVRSRPRPNGRVKASRSDALWKMTRLARARESREAMGTAAREAWKRRFTWERLAADYLELYSGSTAG
jgi:glycosyltransferase involved in cell wall biosynthesis